MKGRDKRIPTTRTIYNNYNLCETYPDEDIREMLIENGYEDEITDEKIWIERYICDATDWDDEKERLKKFFLNGNKWILLGRISRWNGTFTCGMVFDTFEEFFYKATKDCEYIHFYDENGHLYLTCSHHDGRNHYEIKELTDKGINYLENWESNYNDKRTELYIHRQIFNRYSRLPRFAEKVYGCKRVEYEPVTKGALIDKLNNQAKSFYC